MSNIGKNRYKGSKKVLVLRASGSKQGQEPEPSAADLSKAIFDDDEVSLKSRYEACSFGKLKLNKATGKKINNGVLEVKIDIDTDNQDHEWLGEKILKAAEEKLEITHIEKNYDFIMIWLPSGTKLEAAGAGKEGYQKPESLSYFNDIDRKTPKTQMHEIGHNLGFRHSAYKTDNDGDKSCIMSSKGETDGPKLCFNGVKSYLTGWYKNETINFFPKRNTSKQLWDGKLVGVTDYDPDNKDRIVVAEIDTGREEDFNYYILFNRKDGINSDVEFGADKVTITKGYISRNGNFETEGSEHEAGLAVNEEHFIPNYKGSTRDLVIKYHEFVEDKKAPYAHVKIYLEDEQPDENDQSDEGIFGLRTRLN